MMGSVISVGYVALQHSLRSSPEGSVHSPIVVPQEVISADLCQDRKLWEEENWQTAISVGGG